MHHCQHIGWPCSTHELAGDCCMRLSACRSAWFTFVTFGKEIDLNTLLQACSTSRKGIAAFIIKTSKEASKGFVLLLLCHGFNMKLVLPVQFLYANVMLITKRHVIKPKPLYCAMRIRLTVQRYCVRQYNNLAMQRQCSTAGQGRAGP